MLLNGQQIFKMKRKESEKHSMYSLVFGNPLVKWQPPETMMTYREKISEQEAINPTTIRHLTCI